MIRLWGVERQLFLGRPNCTFEIGQGRRFASLRSDEGGLTKCRKGRNAWYNNITWMVDTFDAPVPDREITLLAGYLSAHLGEDNPFGQIPFDLNTTSLEALEKLPFLTSDYIEKLERYRSRQPFTSIQEFTRILELSGDLSRLSRIYLRVDSPSENGAWRVGFVCDS